MIEIMTTTLSAIALISVLTNVGLIVNTVYKPSFTPDDCIVELDKRFGFLTKNDNSAGEKSKQIIYTFESEKIRCSFMFAPYISLNKDFVLNVVFSFYVKGRDGTSYVGYNNNVNFYAESIDATFRIIDNKLSEKFFPALDKYAQHLVFSFVNIFPNSFNRYCQEKVRKISNNIQE